MQGTGKSPHASEQLSLFSSVQFSRSVMCDSLRPHESQHAMPPSITNSQSSLRLTSIESVMPSIHLILCCPLLNANQTAMRYHLTPVRMAIIKMSTNDKCWRGCGKKGMLLQCWWECKLIQPLWKMVWRFVKKLGIKPPYDPAISLLGIYPEETKIKKDTCIPLFTAALFTIASTWKQTRCHLYPSSG